MKKLTFLMISFVFTISTHAKLWRVNINAAINANFTSFVAAQSTVSANDTLYFEGSTISYGDITVTKPLVIIGPGYFLNENPQTQSTAISAKLGKVIFNTGSIGSVITGMEVQSSMTISESNISVIKCLVYGTSSNASNSILLNSTISSIGNISILGDYLTSGIGSSGSNSIFNVLISNNYIKSNLYSSIGLGTYVSGEIKNNISEGDFGVLNFKLSNNIVKSGSVTLNNNTFYNNIGYGSQFPIGNANQQNVNMNDVFVGSTGNSTDGQWQLKQYSPAIGKGNDGTDCGMFGGSSPYVLSGLPSIPAIYEIIMPATGDNINGIDVTIKAKIH